MFAKVAISSRLYSVLGYNERKVENGTARLIGASGFLNSRERLSYQEKFYRFRRQNEMNPQSKMNMVHISLNFDRADKLDKNELSDIADKYLARIGLEGQPYLVYEHYDADHPHIHLVTCNVRRDGFRINLYQTETRFAFLLREIEQEYKMVCKGKYVAMSTIHLALQKVSNEYKFTTLTEYNAVLKEYGVNASRGLPASFLYQKRGLLYFKLDDNGKREGAPVKASDISFKPTLSYLDKKFAENVPFQKENLPSIQKRIDWALFQYSSSLRDFVDELKNVDIELVISNNITGTGSDWVYVDNRSHTAVDGASFGKKYEAQTILGELKIPERILVLGFNPKVPQILSQMLEHDQSFARSAYELSEEQKIQRRPRP